MNSSQKIALWTLIGFLVLPSVGLIIINLGICEPSILGISFFFISLSFFIYLKFSDREKGRVAFDERDEVIKKKASHAALTAVVLYICLLFFILRWKFGENGSVPINKLYTYWLGIFIIYVAVESIAILVQYGRGGKENE